MKKYLSLLTCLFTISLFSQSESFNKIDSIIHLKVKENHPGIAVGIIKNGNVIYEKYRGLSNMQYQVEFNYKTRSNIASTAKQFTALMILDLALKNELNLEDDIRKYLPSLYPKVSEQIKIRHLVNHTSGIRDYVELLDMKGRVWWKRFGLDNNDIMELLQEQVDLGFAPGSAYSYSNSNYIVLTKIIEKVTGNTFNDYSKKFFQSLGMNETSFVEKYMRVIPNRANPYSDWGGGEWLEVPTVTKTNGEGFLYTTLRDQLAYEIALQQAIKNNNTLLINSQKPIPNSEIRTYGFGLELEDKLERTAVHHSGGTFGFHSQTYRFPEYDLSIFIMSNNGSISSNLIALDIARILLPNSKKETTYNDQFYEKRDDIKSILGKYTYPNEDKMVQVIQKEEKTYWQEKNFTVEMELEESDLYSFVNNPKLKVVFFNDKMVEFYPSGKTMTYKKRNDLPASINDLDRLVGKYYNKELDVRIELKLDEENTLKLKFSDDDNFSDVTVYNGSFMMANNYFLKVIRDDFERASEILLTYGRALNISFHKQTNLKFQPKIKTDDGYLQVTTINSKNNDSSDILLTANYPNGNEKWFKKLGGTSYDKASSIIATDDGYLIVGSTSSFGNGNYDIFVIKTDKTGQKQWQNTYGDFYNEYGYTAEIINNGYVIKGTKQKCTSNTDINRECTSNVWFVTIDKKGEKMAEKILEEFKG